MSAKNAKMKTIAITNTLNVYDLNKAEKDGELKYIASVLDSNDYMLRDSLQYSGSRVITFSGLLKHRRIALDEILKFFLEYVLFFTFFSVVSVI